MQIRTKLVDLLFLNLRILSPIAGLHEASRSTTSDSEKQEFLTMESTTIANYR